MPTVSLSTLGLVLNTVGALLLVFFPPTMRRYTEAGQAVVDWVGPATPAGKLRARLQRPLSVSGFALLALGFALQLYPQRTQQVTAAAPRVFLQCLFVDSGGRTHERTYMLTAGGSQVTDGDGDNWQVTLNTPIRLVAEHADVLGGKPQGTSEMLALNRVSGSAEWSRLKERTGSKDDPPEGFRLTQEDESGTCGPAPRRAIE
jgi:hypothetical protein